MTGVPMAKGLAIRNASESLVALEGREALDRALEKAPRELVETLRSGRLLVGTWYPLAWQTGLLAAIAETTPGGRELMRRLGRHSMRGDLGGVYRTFAKLIGPDRSLGVSTRLFNNYYDTGRAEIVESRPGFALVRWSGCTGFDPRLFHLVMGSSESLLECVGGRHVRTHLRSGARDGDDSSEMAAFWE